MQTQCNVLSCRWLSIFASSEDTKLVFIWNSSQRFVITERRESVVWGKTNISYLSKPTRQPILAVATITFAELCLICSTSWAWTTINRLQNKLQSTFSHNNLLYVFCASTQPTPTQPLFHQLYRLVLCMVRYIIILFIVSVYLRKKSYIKIIVILVIYRKKEQN